MANSKTTFVPLRLGVRNVENIGQTIVTLDTGTDYTVYTPSTGKVWVILGMICSNSSATTLTVKSNATAVTPALSLAANQGLWGDLGEVKCMGLVTGDPLVFNSASFAGTVIIGETDLLRL